MLNEKLDLRDRKILYELDKDCRQTDSQIGKKVKLSKQTVAYRIQKLTKNRIIDRFATVVDTYKLGFSKYKVYFSFQNANKETISKMISFLKSQAETEWIATCSGKWDAIAGYIVKDVYEFDNALKKFEEKFRKNISSREISISLGVPHWRKEYLLENKQHEPAIKQGGFKDNFKIDETDEEILKILVNNARMPVTEIAKRLNITPKIAAYRIKNLKKNKIILINRIFLNLEKFNWIFCKALINFKNLTKERYQEFFNHCNALKNLTYIINCVGAWDLEMDFEISDFNTFHKIMLDIRDKFSDIIKDYDFAIILKEDKLDYFPGCYPQYD